MDGHRLLQRQTDRQKQKDTQKDRDQDNLISLILFFFIIRKVG
jgi:hypothetical protein